MVKKISVSLILPVELPEADTGAKIKGRSLVIVESFQFGVCRSLLQGFSVHPVQSGSPAAVFAGTVPVTNGSAFAADLSVIYGYPVNVMASRPMIYFTSFAFAYKNVHVLFLLTTVI